MARIGIFGGSFNPPHVGHLQAAQEAQRLLGLERLLVIPANLPPHKRLPAGSPDARQRLALCEQAFCALPGVQVSAVEIERQGTSYTVETLTELKAQYPNDELVLLMGTDMLMSFRNWVQPERIAELAELAVLWRSEPGEMLERRVREELTALRTQLGAKITLAENHAREMSSTQVRSMIAFDAAEGSVPEAVLQSIRRNGWYGSGAQWKGLPFEKLREIAVSLHKPQRAAHALGCCDTAEQLALRWGADPIAAKRAGILHDVTKALDENQQLRLCQRYAILYNNFEKENPKLLHARTGAAVAREIFGESEAVCEAIVWHTTGKANMSLLEKTLYLADYMEPNREFAGVELLRELAWTDLDAALLEGFRMSLELLKCRGKVVDEHSQQAWEYLTKERNGRL